MCGVYVYLYYATYTILGLYFGSSVKEELQGREMTFHGGNRQSGSAKLTETIRSNVQNKLHTLLI